MTTKHNILVARCTCPACRRRRIRRVRPQLSAAYCTCKPAEQPEPVKRSDTLFLG